MPILNELQIVDDFLTAGAPKLNGNTITLGVIPTCETSPVAVSEGSLMGQLLHGYMQSIFLAPMLSAPEKLQQTPGTLAWLRPAVAKPKVVAQAVAAWVAPQGTVAASGNLIARVDYALVAGSTFAGRSEEHTSELQSLRHLVCRLLLEKTENASTCES